MITTLITFVYFACGIFLFLLAWLILRENPRQTINRILATLLFFGAFGPVLAALGLLIQNSATTALDIAAFQPLFRAWEFFFPQLFLFSLVFPLQHKILKHFPRLYILLYIPPAFHILLLSLFSSGEEVTAITNPENLLPFLGILFEPFRLLAKYALISLAFIRDYHDPYFAVVNLLYIIAAIAIMHMSYSQITSFTLRRQVRLVIWGFRVSAGLYALAFLIPQILLITVQPALSYSLAALGLLLGVGAITWAIIRHRFLDIQFIIRRGFIVSATSGLVAGTYLLMYGEINRLAALAFGDDAMFVQIVLLIFTVIAFQPILNLIEVAVDRIIGQRLGDSRVALQRLSRDVLTLLDKQQLRERVINGLSESMLLEVVYLLLPERNGALQTPVPKSLGRLYRLESSREVVKILELEKRPLSLVELAQAAADSTEIQNLRRLRVRLLIPLMHRGALRGILALGRKITRTDFSPDEMNLLTLLADQLAISLENALLHEEIIEKQRIERELALAKEIQQLLLPKEIPANPEFELSALNIPSRDIGGDFYDFVAVSPSELGVAIGDVSGKGIPGAILMSNLQAVFRANARQCNTPRLVVEHVNNHLASTISAEKYVTFFYGILNSRRKEFTFTNAGHNYPLLCRGADISELKNADLIVGVRRGFAYHQATVRLKPRDLLLFYTDGLTEAIDAAETAFGEQRLTHLLQEHGDLGIHELRDRIYENVLRYAKSDHLLDDVTIVLLRLL